MYYFGAGVMLRQLGSMRLAGLAGAASSVMVLIHYLVTGQPMQLASLPSLVWVFAALMALCSTVLPIYWMALAIQRMGTTHAAAVGNLGPVLTVFAAWLVLGETVSIYQLIGLALVLFGVSSVKAGNAASKSSD
ncbi:DMT family transporter [Zestomonas insulae]|uniref:DMT family transporter n=1 Tax=Zestomonas insulae TaxID=2809017 RepID=UPI003211AE6B